jgi:hypothetical protein
MSCQQRSENSPGRSLATWSCGATVCIRFSCQSINLYIFSNCTSNICFTSDLGRFCQPGSQAGVDGEWMVSWLTF